MSEELNNHIGYKPRVDPVDQHVGNKIKQRRILLGLSLEEVAKELNLTTQQIQKYEAKKDRLSSSRLYKIAKFFRISVNDLFDGLEEEKSTQSLFAEEKEDFRFDLSHVTEREILTLISSFKSIKDIQIRKNILDLVKSLAKNE